MLNVTCGISGSVRIVVTNAQTGEETNDVRFSNIWTDAGLAAISKYATVEVNWPSGLHYGSGVASAPFSSVTKLAQRVGAGNVNFKQSGGVSYDSEICTVTRTSSMKIAKRGVAWTLSEFALSNTDSAAGVAYTYTLVKNAENVVTPVQVAAIEEVTVYYTIQVQYPMTLPPMDVVVQGLPPTTATFTLKPNATAFAEYRMSQNGWGYGQLGSFTNSSFGGVVAGSPRGNAVVWGVNQINTNTEYFGYQDYGAAHIWKVSPPITKNNTQELALEIFWQFSNVTQIEIP